MTAGHRTGDRPELLAPAGSYESLLAAVRSGADAVYLGYGSFHARARARGFSDAEFRDALALCRLRGVRTYLTCNTLLTDQELPLALDQVRTAFRLGVDAVLVQDWGLFRILRAALPDLPIHASTQMSICTSGAARILRADGCVRVVLARECSRTDAASILADGGVEVEVFAHGALCVCRSGQCAMSAVLGGRSGNRGRCAQPCRLPWAVDRRPGGTECALSLKDLCLARHVPDLIGMGVSCLKLEGRLRGPGYVAAVTGIYARLLRENRGPTPEEAADLELAFSRSGFTDAWWTETGGTSMFGPRPAADRRAEREALYRTALARDTGRTVPVEFHCVVERNAPCRLTVSDGPDGHRITVAGAVPEPARTRSLTAEAVADQLRKTGGTVFRCAAASAEVAPGLSLSAAALNALRRSALDALTAARTAPPPDRRELPPPPLPDVDCACPEPQWTASVFTEEQLRAAAGLGFARIAAPVELLASLSALPDAGGAAWCAILPRAWRDRDEPALRRMLDRAASLGVSGILAGNLGHLSLAADCGLPLYGDFGLNVFNAQSLAYLREKGLASACLSLELRLAQMRDMPKILPAEAVVYGRLPLMLLETRPAGAGRSGGDALIDRTGAAFPLLPAYGDRTEVENSLPVWLADRDGWKRAGLAFARFRFTTESAAECAAVCRAYRRGDAAPGAFTRGLSQRGVE